METLAPYGRIGEPDDVAQAAVWLASDASGQVKGASPFVDDGIALCSGSSTRGEPAGHPGSGRIHAVSASCPGGGAASAHEGVVQACDRAAPIRLAPALGRR